MSFPTKLQGLEKILHENGIANAKAILLLKREEYRTRIHSLKTESKLDMGYRIRIIDELVEKDSADIVAIYNKESVQPYFKEASFVNAVRVVNDYWTTGGKCIIPPKKVTRA